MCEKKRRVFADALRLGMSRSGMLGVGYKDLCGGYLLEWMALHTGTRAANVVGRSGVVYIDQCVIWCLRRYLVVRLRKRCGGVRGR